MIYLLIFTVAGFIVIMVWCWKLHVNAQNNYDILVEWYRDLDIKIHEIEVQSEEEQTLSELLLKWDEAYANSDKYQRRMMTINRQRYGIRTAAEMHGVM
jgi:hypothetical protein